MTIRKLVLLLEAFVLVTIFLSSCGSSKAAKNEPEIVEQTEVETTAIETTEEETKPEIEETTTKESEEEEIQEEAKAEKREVIELQSFESVELDSGITKIELREKSTDAFENPLTIYKEKDVRAKLNFSYISSEEETYIKNIAQGRILESTLAATGLGDVSYIGDIATFSLKISDVCKEESYHIIYEVRFAAEPDDYSQYMVIKVVSIEKE